MKKYEQYIVYLRLPAVHVDDDPLTPFFLHEAQLSDSIYLADNMKGPSS